MTYNNNTTVVNIAQPIAEQTVRCIDCGCEWVAHLTVPWAGSSRRVKHGLCCPACCFTQTQKVCPRQWSNPANLPWVKQIIKQPQLKQKEQKTMSKDKIKHTHPNGKTYTYHNNKPKGPSRQCPKCGLWASNSVPVCKCGYEWSNKTKTKQPKPKGTQQVQNNDQMTPPQSNDQINKVIGVLASALILSDADNPETVIKAVEQALLCPGVGERALGRIGDVLNN